MFWIFSQDSVPILSSNCVRQVKFHIGGRATFYLRYLHQLLQARTPFRGKQAGMEVIAVPVVI